MRLLLTLCALFLAAPASAQPVFSDTHVHGETGTGRPQSVNQQRLDELRRLGQLEPVLEYRTDPDVNRLTNYVGFFDGLLSNDQPTLCTAVLIDTDKILTNARCVAPPRFRPARALSVYFTLGYFSSFSDAEERQFRVRPRPLEIGEADGLDYAILELEDPVPGFEPHGFQARDPRAGERLVILGHPDAAALHMTRGGCRAHSTPIHPDQTRMNHRCDTLGGNSGSLIFTPDLTTVVGLHNAGGDAGINHGIRIAALREASPLLRAAFQTRAPVPEPARPTCAQIAVPDGFRCVEGSDGTLSFAPIAVAQPAPVAPYGIPEGAWIAGTPGQPGAVFQDCAECPEMVVLPAGRYLRGSPDDEVGREDDEGPVKAVRIPAPFAVGRFEVTVADFRRFVKATGHHTWNTCWTYDGGWSLHTRMGWADPGFVQGDDHPVTCVNWEGAQAYVTWLNTVESGAEYRLLTEAEWEYAARGRGGDSTSRASARYFWGDDTDANRACDFSNGHDATSRRVNKFAWTAFDCDDGFAQTAPVGTFNANGFGLFDMSGNLWEWVGDCYADSYNAALVNSGAVTTLDCGLRVLRGGSWQNVPGFLRSAYRYRSGTVFSSNFYGFRLARTLTP